MKERMIIVQLLSGPKATPAIVFGNWAAHGIFHIGDPADEPDDQDFTVTHVPSGLNVNRASGFLTRDHAVQLAELLSLTVQGDTEQDVLTNKRTVHNVVALVEQLRWGHCDNHRERCPEQYGAQP